LRQLAPEAKQDGLARGFGLDAADRFGDACAGGIGDRLGDMALGGEDVAKRLPLGQLGGEGWVGGGGRFDPPAQFRGRPSRGRIR
jgi:hypothetical protein